VSISLAFSTNAFTRFPLAEALERIAGHGYKAVEILADVPHAYPPTTSDADLDEIKRVLDDLGLAVSNLNANTMFGHWTDAPPEPFFEPSLVSTVPEFRDLREATIVRSLEMAARLGARNITITTGKPLGAMSPEACAPVLEERLGRLLKRAESLEVNLGIECEPGLYVETTEELLGWIDRMGSPRLGANLDIGHAVCSGEDPAESIRKLTGRIWNLHIEDIQGRKHYHLIPGQGDIDFAAVAEALNAIGYDRWATVELYTQSAEPDRAAAETMKVLSPIFA
jgi:fructoselysine 3-epimerase